MQTGKHAPLVMLGSPKPTGEPVWRGVQPAAAGRRKWEGVASFYHAASGTYFRILQRGGKFYQRRWQKGGDGAETNVEE